MLTDYHTHTPLCLHAEGDPARDKLRTLLEVNVDQVLEIAPETGAA